MTISVKVGEAKAHLSELLHKVEAGEDVIISRGDEPIVRMVALRKNDDVLRAIESLKAIRLAAKPVTQEEIRAWRDEGRP